VVFLLSSVLAQIFIRPKRKSGESRLCATSDVDGPKSWRITPGQAFFFWIRREHFLKTCKITQRTTGDRHVRILQQQKTHLYSSDISRQHLFSMTGLGNLLQAAKPLQGRKTAVSLLVSGRI